MAKARALDKRRKAIRNIRKITRTMELIATARFKKAMDRAHAATAYTQRITQLVADLANSGLEVRHPLLEGRETTERAMLLVLTANRGLCGGYNGGVQRAGFARYAELKAQVPQAELEISGKRGLAAAKFRQMSVSESYTHFEDKPSFEEVELLANRYLQEYVTGKLDRLDVAYMQLRKRQPASGRGRNAAAAGVARASVTGEHTTAFAVRVPPVGRKHPGRGRADELQGQAVQVLSRRGGQRAGFADGGHEGRHQSRRRSHPRSSRWPTTGPGNRRSLARSWKSSGASRRSKNNGPRHVVGDDGVPLSRPTDTQQPTTVPWQLQPIIIRPRKTSAT